MSKFPAIVPKKSLITAPGRQEQMFSKFPVSLDNISTIGTSGQTLFHTEIQSQGKRREKEKVERREKRNK